MTTTKVGEVHWKASRKIGQHNVPMRVWYNLIDQRYHFEAKTRQERIWVLVFNELYNLVEFRDQHKPTVEIFTETVRMTNYMSYSIWKIAHTKGHLVE